MKKRRAWNAWDCEERQKDMGSWTVLVVVVVQRRRAESGRQPSSALRCCVSVVTGRPWLELLTEKADW
ncbi:unnamed protein product [Sphagnum troendelagicum]|uniref:Uncharacterized protein n=1 Tax=Sphagnum troendelagicum TaxID=128251 RepID=A0ABP0TNW8_9BRYO